MNIANNLKFSNELYININQKLFSFTFQTPLLLNLLLKHLIRGFITFKGAQVRRRRRAMQSITSKYGQYLFKAFDALNHNLSLAKLNAYGFSFNPIKFVQSYLSERFQTININNNFSEWCKILLGVPQRSILVPLFFNIQHSIFYLNTKRLYLHFADYNL